MVIKKTNKTDVTIKQAYVEDGKLVDTESGEILDIVDVISKIYEDQEVKISITASSSEEVTMPETDSEIEE